LLICQRDVAFTAVLASFAWYLWNVANTTGLGSDAVGSRKSQHFEERIGVGEFISGDTAPFARHLTIA
jgi:hypothetical protein